MNSEPRTSSIRFVQKENVRLREENDLLRAEVEQAHRVLETLCDLQTVSTTITSDTDVLALLEQILQSALLSIGALDGSLSLVDEDTGELEFVVVHGEIAHTLVGYRIASGEGIAGWVAQQQEAVIVPNAHVDPRFSHRVDQTFQFHTRSLMCVPIIYAGETLGVMQALNKQGRDFNQTDLKLLGVVAQLAATAMRRADEVLIEAEG